MVAKSPKSAAQRVELDKDSCKFGSRLEARRLWPRLRDRYVGEHDQASRSGLGHPEKPIGCFSSPANRRRQNGIGQTVGQDHGIEFLRFDMSEYMEKHTVSRLIGAPPGYVGFDQGGIDGLDQPQSLCRVAA